jgi:hypothetical protein
MSFLPPVLYLPPSRYTNRTNAAIPVLVDFFRGAAVMGLEWTTLKFIEDAPVLLRAGTFVISLAVLAVLKSKDWLDFKGRWHFYASLSALVGIYLGIASYAYWTAEIEPARSARSAGGFGFNEAVMPPRQPEKQLGSTFSIQLAQLFHALPQRCLIKITNASDSELASVINWVTTYGNIPPGVICAVQPNDKLPDADQPALKWTTEPGMVVHWKATYEPGEKLAHFFASTGVNVRTSHQLDVGSPDNLVWFDIGPGSPWK